MAVGAAFLGGHVLASPVQTSGGSVIELNVGSLQTGSSRPLAISPDGALLVVAAFEHGSTRLYVGELDRFDARPIPGSEGAQNPFFSPDGKWIGFFADGELRKIELTRGSSHTIC